jgi:hypothetical protein
MVQPGGLGQDARRPAGSLALAHLRRTSAQVIPVGRPWMGKKDQFLQLIIGVIIGPRAEIQLRRALQGGGGDPLHLFSEPMAVATYAVIAVILLWPLIAKLIRRARGANTPKEA